MAPAIKQMFRTKTKYDEVKIFLQHFLSIKNSVCYKGEKAVDKEIDARVYALYGLTEEEIATIEG